MMKSAAVLTTSALFAFVSALFLPLAACDNGSGAVKREPPGSKAGALAAGDPVETLYRDRCSGCHGATGRGDGSLSTTMQVKPRDFTDPAWRATSSDEKVRTAILKGGKSVGGSELMPGSPDLEKRPEVLEPLVKKVRAFQR